MRVSAISNTPFTPSEHRSIYYFPYMTRSSIAMCENGTIKKSSPIRQFFEDFAGFMGNVILFPILGHQVMMYQLIMAIFLPILLPYILIMEVIHVLLNCLTCGCSKDFFGPSLDLSQPSSKERLTLERLVNVYGTKQVGEEQQIDLAHIMSRYVDYANAYVDPEGYGMRNGHFQAIVSIDIDGTSHQLQFCPGDDKEKLVQEYLETLAPHLKEDSQVKHHFVGLDYHYIFGLLKMRIQTDEVLYDCNEGINRGIPLCGGWLRIFAPSLGKHIRKDAEDVDSFSLWPGATKRVICEKINAQLEKGKIEASSLSLFDADQLIRG